MLGERQMAGQRHHHRLSQDSRLTLSITALQHNPLHHRVRPPALPPTAHGSLEDHKPSSLSSSAPWKGTFSMFVSARISELLTKTHQCVLTIPHCLFTQQLLLSREPPSNSLCPSGDGGTRGHPDPPMMGRRSQHF